MFTLMDPEEKRKQLEKDILNIIAQKLQNGQMDLQRAELIAKMLLDKLHPPLTLEQIYEIAPTLDDEYTELSAAIQPIIYEHDEKIKNIVVTHAEKLIKSGKIDEASNLITDALNKKKEDSNE